VIIDKAGSIHTLMLDKDQTLNERIGNFVKEEKRKHNDMVGCRNSF